LFSFHREEPLIGAASYFVCFVMKRRSIRFRRTAFACCSLAASNFMNALSIGEWPHMG